VNLVGSFFYYVFAMWWGVQVVISQDFFWKTELCWVGWPDIPMSPSFKLYYFTQLAFYIHSFIAHVTIEVRRKDFIQMLVHHVASGFLIAYSYYHSVFRIGGVLLVLHDINDIFLEAAKMGNYLKVDTIANILFGSTIVSWGISRIYLYSVKVLYPSWYEVIDIAKTRMFEWRIFYTLLTLVFVLNFFWLSLMLRIAYKTIAGLGLKDIRED